MTADKMSMAEMIRRCGALQTEAELMGIEYTLPDCTTKLDAAASLSILQGEVNEAKARAKEQESR